MLNKTDSALIAALNDDGRASQRELASSTKVALGTVSNHLKKLESEKIIRGYLPDIDPEKVGFTLTAVMHVRIMKGHIMEVQSSIAEHPRVFGVYDVTGEWDSMVLARFTNREEMDSFIKTALSQKNIERTNTSLVLNTVKEESRVIL
ncbi:MAG: hypothetical protein BEU04_03525 [Marine Group III euryarchaeote CG-Bathy1]|uniref:HTH asnC-type domain-containing protein n=1 Tax=Marine Group III euryarchaeote CG-Bathy1 TaxID=1889001 RepID=A0A1J5TPZ0_9ARCH|nr:MAG: hypothetical protein BEU04_03525 [Marine Group III euryarchaeote CG-Bathy1]